MTDRDVVERVGALFERAVLRLSPRAARHKPLFITTVRGAAAVELMASMRPHLGGRRQGQIARALGGLHLGQRATAAATRFVCEADCDIHWVAGLLEGEGSFGSLTKQGGPIPGSTSRCAMATSFVARR
jgi:hypothetical protein